MKHLKSINEVAYPGSNPFPTISDFSKWVKKSYHSISGITGLNKEIYRQLKSRLTKASFGSEPGRYSWNSNNFQFEINLSEIGVKQFVSVTITKNLNKISTLVEIRYIDQPNLNEEAGLIISGRKKAWDGRSDKNYIYAKIQSELKMSQKDISKYAGTNTIYVTSKEFEFGLKIDYLTIVSTIIDHTEDSSNSFKKSFDNAVDILNKNKEFRSNFYADFTEEDLKDYLYDLTDEVDSFTIRPTIRLGTIDTEYVGYIAKFKLNKVGEFYTDSVGRRRQNRENLEYVKNIQRIVNDIKDTLEPIGIITKYNLDSSEEPFLLTAEFYKEIPRDLVLSTK
jgi:hypothetical protein